MIVAEAREWLGTPYHHLADVKGVGVDCAMLLVRVFVDAGVVPAFDPRKPKAYSPEWYFHRSEEIFLGVVQRFGDRIQDGAEPMAGDVVLFTFGRCISHGGIVEDERYFIHADRRAARVVRCEHGWNQDKCAGYWRVRE